MNNKGFSHIYMYPFSPSQRECGFLVAVLKAMNLKESFPGDSVVKNLPANAGDAGNSYPSDGCGADGLRSRVKYGVKTTPEVCGAVGSPQL